MITYHTKNIFPGDVMVHIFIGQWKMLYVGDMILVAILVLGGAEGVSPHHQAVVQKSAGCPTIQLNPNTVHLEIVG